MSAACGSSATATGSWPSVTRPRFRPPRRSSFACRAKHSSESVRTECPTRASCMMSLSSYRNHESPINVGAPALLLLVLILALAAPARTPDTAAVLQDDRAFIQAFEQNSSALALKLLAADFVWINYAGKRFRRAEALSQFPAVANADVAPEIRVYGNSAVVRSNQGKMHVV